MYIFGTHFILINELKVILEGNENIKVCLKKSDKKDR